MQNNLETAKLSGKCKTFSSSPIFKSGKCNIIWKMQYNLEIAKHSVVTVHLRTVEVTWNILYLWEGSLLEIKILFRYLENILISRRYEQFSRKWSNLGHF